MSAPTIDRDRTTRPEPILSVFAVRAELEPHADNATLAYFGKQVDSGIEHAVLTGSFDQLHVTLRTWLGIGLMAQNADRIARLSIEQRGQLQNQLIREWIATRPDAARR
jgi:hypothetical protein